MLSDCTDHSGDVDQICIHEPVHVSSIAISWQVRTEKNQISSARFYLISQFAP